MKVSSLSINEPQQSFCAGADFDVLFQVILQTRQFRSQNSVDQHAAQHKINSQFEQCADSMQMELACLARHPNYSRHTIGQDGEWYGLLCRWEAGAQSSIHGHPAFTYYHVLEGDFVMDIYQRQRHQQISWQRSIFLRKGQSYWEYGIEGRYDNLIHRVRAQTSGITIQLFSEDPQRGEVFRS